MTLGGIIIPKVPPDAIDPLIKASLYPCLLISGAAICDIVAAVAIEEPQIIPKPAQAPTVDIARPPL